MMTDRAYARENGARMPLSTICCPQLGPKGTRMAEWESIVDRFVRDDAMTRLFTLFGHSPDMSLPLRRLLADERAFANAHWDYRRRLASGERWLLDDGDPVAEGHRDEIVDIATSLGMRDGGIPSDAPCDYDWVLCLGGARNANLERAALAVSAGMRCHSEGSTTHIMGLAGDRRIAPIEMPYVTRVIPDAAPESVRESDVMLASLLLASDGIGGNAPTGIPFATLRDETECEQGHGWQIRHLGRACVIVADPKEGRARANTADTMDAFIEAMGVSDGAKLAIVTSPIYVPYQTAALVPLALRGGFSFDMMGSVPLAGDTEQVGGMATKYLQEVNGTLDAVMMSLDLDTPSGYPS